MSTSSVWVTNRKYALGFREEGGLTLIKHRGTFVLLTDRVLPVEADSLAEAIAKSDMHLPPPGWSFVVGMWVAPGWKIQAGEGGWVIYAEDGKKKSKQVFGRADLARKWCEVRNDRVGLNLRGPKPKSTLPEVEAEVGVEAPKPEEPPVVTTYP